MCFCALFSTAQTAPIYADTTLFGKRASSAGHEIKIINSTRHINGALFNTGNGITNFRTVVDSIAALNDTTIRVYTYYPSVYFDVPVKGRGGSVTLESAITAQGTTPFTSNHTVDIGHYDFTLNNARMLSFETNSDDLGPIVKNSVYLNYGLNATSNLFAEDVTNSTFGTVEVSPSGASIYFNDNSSFVVDNNFIKARTSAKEYFTADEGGILISLLTQSERDAISSPAEGQLLYQTDNTPGFYYYDGSAWIKISVGIPTITWQETLTADSISTKGALFKNSRLSFDNTDNVYIVDTVINWQADPSNGMGMYAISDYASPEKVKLKLFDIASGGISELSTHGLDLTDNYGIYYKESASGHSLNLVTTGLTGTHQMFFYPSSLSDTAATRKWVRDNFSPTGGSGITSLNSQTGSTQTFATGTSGSDFGINSSSNTHTFNLPTASASNRGALSSSDWTTFNNKAGLGLNNTFTGTNTFSNDIGGSKWTIYNATGRIVLDNNTISSNGSGDFTAVSFSGAGTGLTGIASSLSIGGNAATVTNGLYNTLADGKIYLGNGSNVATAVTPSGDVTMTNAGVTSIGAVKVLNSMLAGSITASKLVGTDIATVGTITSGTWNGTAVANAYIATALTGKTYNGLNITTTTGTLTMTGSKSLQVDNSVTMVGTDGSTVNFLTGGSVAYQSNNLSVFGSTTSAQLRTVLSDETGTGAAVFASAPVMSAAEFTGLCLADNWTIRGTAGNGYLHLKNAQSSNPSAPGSGVLLFADASERLSWLRADGYKRTFASTLTADRIYTLPDATGTVVLNDNTATLTNKTIGVTQLNGSANTVAVNNTGSTANYTEATYKSVASQSYGGTIAWTGTTAPSGTTNHTYSWQQIGNMVTIRINLVYGTAGTALTAVSMTLPSDCPNPAEPSGLTAASNIISTGSGGLASSKTSGISNNGKGYIRANSGDTGYELFVEGANVSATVAYLVITYFTN